MLKSNNFIFLSFVLAIFGLSGIAGIANQSFTFSINQPKFNSHFLSDHPPLFSHFKVDQSIPGDWISYYADIISINIGDGLVDKSWTDVPEYIVEEYTGVISQGWVKSIHDDFYIYSLISVPILTKWFAIEFNSSDKPESSMQLNNDGWVFGEGTKIPSGELFVNQYIGDVHFLGQEHPIKDKRNDLTYEFIIDEDNEMKYVEIRRPLNTQDAEDFVFTENSIFNIKFASSLNAKYHKNGGTTHLMNITPEIVQKHNSNSTQSTVKRRTPDEIKAENESKLFILTNIALFINFTLISLMIIFFGKKKE